MNTYWVRTGVIQSHVWSDTCYSWRDKDLRPGVFGDAIS